MPTSVQASVVPLTSDSMRCFFGLPPFGRSRKDNTHCCAAGFQFGRCRLRVKLGPSAMSAQMSGLPESGHGWAIYE